MGRNSLHFIICTEKGILERQSLLLIKSIRKNAGKLKDCPITSFSPRSGNQISDKAISRFNDFNVRVICDELNYKYTEYPFANKILACSYAEREFNEEIIVFLDSDQIIFNEPNVFALSQAEIGVKPVERKGIAFTSQADKNYIYWETLLKKFGIGNYPSVSTVMDEEIINGYWNAGNIAFRNKMDFAHEWLNIFTLLFNQKFCPGGKLTFLDQISLALAIYKRRSRIAELPSGYGFPYEFIAKDREMDTSNIISLHYHKLFTYTLKNNPFEMLKDRNNIKHWLMRELKICKLYPQSHFMRLKIAYHELFK